MAPTSVPGQGLAHPPGQLAPLVQGEADDLALGRIEQDVADLGDVVAGQGDHGQADEIGAPDQGLHCRLPRWTATMPPAGAGAGA